MSGTTEEFAWPDGRKAALSITFDDTRASQLECGLPILDAHRVKATFYVSLKTATQRQEQWQQLPAAGHELGNHTLNHPCSANFGFSRTNVLERYTLEQMAKELTGANEEIEKLFGVRPATFAYPCGQKYVGRGEAVRSYVPLVAKHFLVGRGFMDEFYNPPLICDLAQAMARSFDEVPFSLVEQYLAHAIAGRGWLIVVGHDVSEERRQAVRPDTLERLCQFATDPTNGIWVDTVERVGEYIRASRSVEAFR